MAEGGDLTSIKDDLEYTCTLCREDGVREAIKYCPECEEHLCTSCTRHHGRLKPTKAHALVNCDASTKGMSVAMVTKCSYHPDRDNEMYCGAHDMVYCMKCIIDNHRSCKGVSDLEKVSQPTQEIERLKTEVKYIQERLDDTDQKLHTNINSVEKQRNEIISNIENIERDLVERIRKLKHEALETLNSDFTLAKEEIETNVSQTRKVKQEIEQASSLLQIIDGMNMRQQFVQTKLIQQIVNNALIYFEERAPKGSQSIRFTENTEIKSLIIALTSLGSVQATGKNLVELKLHKVISRTEINIKMKNELSQVYISDMCKLADGTIILADLNNRRIKRIGSSYYGFNMKDSLDLESSPTGVCCTGKYDEVAVKLTNNKVWFISVGTSLSKVRDIYAEGVGYGNGMAHRAREIWVSHGYGVGIYSMAGTCLKTISQDINGQRKLKSTAQQIAVSGDTVIVTDSSDGAVCLNRDGTVKRELRDKSLSNTRGICVANDGTVFISGYGSNNIMMFDSDGKCLGELVGKGAGLVNPTSLLYDDKKNCLIVACYLDKIIVYNT